MSLMGLLAPTVLAPLYSAAAEAAAAPAAAAVHEHPFNALDWAVIAVFITAMVGVVVWASLKKNESGTDYFLAGRNAGWIQIGSSIFSSNIGSEHLVGLAGAGFITGMAMAHWEMHAWLILVLGWVFVPLYDRMKVFTMPEYLERRFSPGSRSILSFLTMASLVLTKIAATIYAGDVVIRTLLGIDSISIFGMNIDVFWAIALGLAFTTGLYTVFGGMRVIMYTAVLQTPVLLFGSFAILWIGLSTLGNGSLSAGWDVTVAKMGDQIHLVRSNSDTDWPWLAVLPGSAIIGFWYWCTDQYIVQRVLAGKNQEQSRRGSIFAGYLKLTPVFIFLVPGMIAFALTQTPGAVNGQDFVTTGDAAYTSLVAQILPHGIKGIVACGMLVALMASLASKFNASATLFTMDFYLKWRPNAQGKEIVTVGRLATAVIVTLGILWVLVMKQMGGSLYEYLQNVQAYLSPAIAVLFLVGVFWKRATAASAFWAFLVATVVGFFRLGLDLLIAKPIHHVKALMKENTDALLSLSKQAYAGTADQIAIIKGQITALPQQIATAIPGVKEQLELKLYCLQQQVAGSVLSPEAFNEKIRQVAKVKEVAGSPTVEVLRDVRNAVEMNDQSLVATKTHLSHVWGWMYTFQQEIHWLYFAQALFVFTIIFMVVVSLFTKAPEPGTIKYTWYGATPAEIAETRASWNKWDVFHTCVVLGCVIAFYICFW